MLLDVDYWANYDEIILWKFSLIAFRDSAAFSKVTSNCFIRFKCWLTCWLTPTSTRVPPHTHPVYTYRRKHKASLVVRNMPKCLSYDFSAVTQKFPRKNYGTTSSDNLNFSIWSIGSSKFQLPSAYLILVQTFFYVLLRKRTWNFLSYKTWTFLSW